MKGLSPLGYDSEPPSRAALPSVAGFAASGVRGDTSAASRDLHRLHRLSQVTHGWNHCPCLDTSHITAQRPDSSGAVIEAVHLSAIGLYDGGQHHQQRQGSNRSGTPISDRPVQSAWQFAGPLVRSVRTVLSQCGQPERVRVRLPPGIPVAV